MSPLGAVSLGCGWNMVKEISVWRFCFFNSCSTASSASRSIFSCHSLFAFFFLHHLLVSFLFESPARIPEHSLFSLWPPTLSWFSPIPSAPFPLWHSSALTLLYPWLSLSFCRNILSLCGTLRLMSCFGVAFFFPPSIKLSKLSFFCDIML